MKKKEKESQNFLPECCYIHIRKPSLIPVIRENEIYTDENIILENNVDFNASLTTLICTYIFFSVTAFPDSLRTITAAGNNNNEHEARIIRDGT